MSEYFSVTYQGPALDEHRIPVTDLAPSLLALSEMFVVAHRAVGDRSTPAPGLDVRANRAGSFAVELVLDPGQAVDLLSQAEVVATATAVTLLEPVVNAFRYLRHARLLGRNHTSVVVEPGQVRITWSDGTTFEGPAEAVDLANDMDFRRAARATLAPLERREGVDSLLLQPEGDGAGTAITLDADDARGLDLPPQDPEIFAETVRQAQLSPIKPSFEPEKKWWVSDGAQRFWVSMHDLAFMQQVETNMATFGAGDVLLCRLRTRVLRSDNTVAMTVEHIVEEVLAHLHRPPAEELPYEG